MRTPAKSGARAEKPTLTVVRTGSSRRATNALMSRLLHGKAEFRALYNASQLDRIQMVNEGVPSSFVNVLVRDLGMTKERFYGIIGVARATVDRKVKDNKVLDRAESESVLAMARLIGQVEEMVNTSGEPEGFDAAQWVSDWIQRPLPALGRRCPADLMDTAEGRTLVSDLVAQMASGAYA